MTDDRSPKWPLHYRQLRFNTPDNAEWDVTDLNETTPTEMNPSRFQGHSVPVIGLQEHSVPVLDFQEHSVLYQARKSTVCYY